jgi:hypothetical protein
MGVIAKETGPRSKMAEQAPGTAGILGGNYRDFGQHLRGAGREVTEVTEWGCDNVEGAGWHAGS